MGYKKQETHATPKCGSGCAKEIQKWNKEGSNKNKNKKGNKIKMLVKQAFYGIPSPKTKVGNHLSAQ